MDKTQITTIAYNANAQAYADKFMEHKPYVEQVREFARYLSDGDTLLDVGCGPGNVAKHLLSTKAIAVTGIDLSDEMVALARKNAPSGTFFVQDSRFADFPAAHFDTVVLSFSVVHLNDEEAYKLIANAVSWMKRKGFLYLSFMEGKQAGFEQTSFSQDPIYFNYFCSSEIEQYLNGQGIKILRSIRQDYFETNGDITTDVFVFGQKE